MKKVYLKPIMTGLAGSFLLTGCWPFDDDNPAAVDTSPSNDTPSISLANTITTLAENTDTVSALHVADIVITDDASGTNTLNISGNDSALFEIVGFELRLTAGADLDFDTNPSLNVTVEVDDIAIGSTPDDRAELSISITDVNASPTISLTNTTTAINENTDTSSSVHIADIVISDDKLCPVVMTAAAASLRILSISRPVAYLSASS